jgi:glycine/D-amino acid oxidase-like deaminating enzyme
VSVRNGAVSFWWSALGGPPPRRAPLPGSLEADVAIVGAGYSGLWTAWYLKRADPSLHVVVLEREAAGFGASGRNGGWLSGLLAGSREAWAAAHGRGAVVAAQRAMFATVDEVAAWCAEQGVDCDLVKGGTLDVATSEPAWRRLQAELAEERAWGFGEEDWRLLPASEVRERVRLRSVRGGLFTPHCARVQPAKLVRGLAEAVERAGVPIYEDTPVTEVRPGCAVTARGEVRARWIVRATEGYTAGLAGERRTLVPLNSSMVVTAPLGEDFWSRAGWEHAETVRDAQHAYCYLQRTADGRIAIGGRGVPYRFGSRTDRAGEVAERTVAQLRGRLARLFEGLEDVALEHAWAGVLGVARDWSPSVGADPASGLAWAGGYVGDGVSTANLAGRTLRDLILGRDTELARLPWVGHRSGRWEPEPLRWLGIHAVYGLYRLADRDEERTQRPSRIAAVADRVAGR